MIIQEIIDNRVVPFDIADVKLKELFSFYLHKAPLIDSRCSGNLPSCGCDIIWNNLITTLCIEKSEFHIYSSGYVTDKNLETYDLKPSSTIDRKSKRFVGYKKEGEHSELECLLRHLRNSIAHGNVFLLIKANRKYIIFDDYNNSNHLTARIMLGQTDLMKFRKLLGG